MSELKERLLEDVVRVIDELTKKSPLQKIVDELIETDETGLSRGNQMLLESLRAGSTSSVRKLCRLAECEVDVPGHRYTNDDVLRLAFKHVQGHDINVEWLRGELIALSLRLTNPPVSAQDRLVERRILAAIASGAIVGGLIGAMRLNVVDDCELDIAEGVYAIGVAIDRPYASEDFSAKSLIEYFSGFERDDWAKTVAIHSHDFHRAFGVFPQIAELMETMIRTCCGQEAILHFREEARQQRKQTDDQPSTTVG